MNCEEFKHQYLMQEQTEEVTKSSHVNECKECKRFLENMHKLDSHLATALNKISVPDDLAHNIMQEVTKNQINLKNRTIKLVGGVIAAGIFIFALFPVFIWLDFKSLNNNVISHVMHEKQAIQASNNYTFQDLNQQLSYFNLKASNNIVPPVYIKDCKIGQHKYTKHFVFNTPHGKATVLVFPNTKVYKEYDIKTNLLKAHYMPLNNGGLIAILTEQGQDISDLVKYFKQNIIEL